MATAFVFPGQGSQSVGMLGTFGAAAGALDIIKDTFAEGSHVLGYDLWHLVSAGPENDLNATERTQPAMLAAGIAVWRVWQARGGGQPEVVSGHSLGEFTALVAAEALTFADGIALVRERGRMMQEAVPVGIGAMAAVLGVEDAAVEAACGEVSRPGDLVEAVNFNSPGQVVIAGHNAAVARAIDVLRTRGARRAVTLPLSVPSHSSLMRDAAQRFGARLASTLITPPAIAYWSAVDATAHSDPDEIRRTLVTQLASPVRWSQTVRALIGSGITRFVECGPGSVLTGLNRRIEKRPDLQSIALDDAAAFEAAVAAK